MGLLGLVVAIDEPGAIVASAQSVKKSRADRFAYQIALKGRSSGVILVGLFPRFASVDTIPNAVRSTFDKNSSRLCAC